MDHPDILGEVSPTIALAHFAERLVQVKEEGAFGDAARGADHVPADPSTIQNCSEGSISLKLAGIFYNESSKSLIRLISTQVRNQ